jgi:hypothetical protein
MERLEAAGILRLFWAKRRTGEDLAAAELADPRALFGRLDRPVPEDQAASLMAASASLADAAAARGEGPAAAFFRFLSGKADSLGGRIGPKDLEDAAALFAFPPKDAAGLPLRALSIRLYRDSKRLEELASLLGPLIARAAAEHPESAALGFPERIYPEAAIAGAVELEFTDGRVWPLSFSPIVLSLAVVGDLRSIRARSGGGSTDRPRALSVENKETFHAFSRVPAGFHCIICSAGHPNRAVRAVLGLLAAGGFDVYHAGDLDADGIAILSEISDLCGARPYGMDAATFDRYLPYARDLDAALVARLKSIPGTAFALPGIAGLVDRIRETSRGVEQEIIDYGALTVFPPRCPS